MKVFKLQSMEQIQQNLHSNDYNFGSQLQLQATVGSSGSPGSPGSRCSGLIDRNLIADVSALSAQQNFAVLGSSKLSKVAVLDAASSASCRLLLIGVNIA
jgi:hypothetical protein